MLFSIRFITDNLGETGNGLRDEISSSDALLFLPKDSSRERMKAIRILENTSKMSHVTSRLVTPIRAE